MLSKIMRNVTVLFISFALVGATLVTAPKAFAEEDIMQYVVSGSGTFEDPYVFGKDNEYKDMFDEMVESSIKASNSLTRHQFTASLTGTKYYDQTYGGIWRYTYGGGDVMSDGVFVYSSINYVGEEDTRRTYVALTDSRYSDIICDSLRQNTVSTLANKLITAGMLSTAAYGVVKFFELVPVADIINSKTKAALADATYNGNGSLVVEYDTSYHGSWYRSEAVVEWDTYPTVYTPGSAYGYGYYTSR